MARTWEREKRYRAKRAAQAVAEMEAAIEVYDVPRFLAAWDVAMRYMNVKDRRPYYIRMLKRGCEIKREAMAQ